MHPSAWRGIQSAVLAPNAISPTLQGKSSLVLPCAAVIPFRFTNVPGHSTLELSTLDETSLEDVRQNDFLLRFRIAPYEMTVFADGRAI